MRTRVTRIQIHVSVFNPDFVAPNSTSKYSLIPAHTHTEDPTFQHECGQHLWRAVSVTTVRSWCKNLKSLSGKMVALTYNLKESSIGFHWYAILMTRSQTLSAVAKRLTSIIRVLVQYSMEICECLQDAEKSRIRP